MKPNIRYWRSVLREAERELDAATGRMALNAAAKKLMRAKAELKVRSEASGRQFQDQSDRAVATLRRGAPRTSA